MLYLVNRWHRKISSLLKHKGRKSIWNIQEMQQGLLWNPKRNHRVHSSNLKLVTLLEHCWTVYKQRPQQYPAHLEQLLHQEPILITLGLARLTGWYKMRPKALRRILRCAKQGRFPLPTRVEIPKPGTAETRPLTVPCKAQRVRMKAINILLRPLIMDHAIEQHGFRPHCGVHTCWETLLPLLHSNLYAWEFDYRKFYDSLSFDAINTTLEAAGFTQSLIAELTPHKYREGGTIKEIDKGILQGFPTSPLISILVLQHYEAYKSRDYTYLGYADDGLIFGNEETIITLLENKVAKAGLTLKPAATKLIKTPDTLTPFTFLGLHYDGQTLTLNTRSGFKQGLEITLATLRTLYSPTYSKWQLRNRKHTWNYSITDKTWVYIPKPPKVRPNILRTVTRTQPGSKPPRNPRVTGEHTSKVSPPRGDTLRGPVP